MGDEQSLVPQPESFRHSCGTLEDGIEYMDLAIEEQDLEKQLEAGITFQQC